MDYIGDEVCESKAIIKLRPSIWCHIDNRLFGNDKYFIGVSLVALCWMNDKGISQYQNRLDKREKKWTNERTWTGNVHASYTPVCLQAPICRATNYLGRFFWRGNEKMKAREEEKKNAMPLNFNVGCSKSSLQLIEITIYFVITFAKKKQACRFRQGYWCLWIRENLTFHTINWCSIFLCAHQQLQQADTSSQKTDKHPIFWQLIDWFSN